MPSPQEELKKTVDELGTAITAMRAENDKRLKEIEAKGGTAAEYKAAVDKATADVVALEAKFDEEKAKIRELETLTARLSLSPRDAKDKEGEDVVAFFRTMASVRKNPALAQVGADARERYLAYKKALNQYMRNPQEALGTPEIQAALQVGSDPAGGYTVTPDNAGRIATLIFETSPMRQYAFIQNTGKDRVMGFNDLDEDDTGTGWVGETAARPETNTAELGKWEIPVHEQYANPKASSQSLEDSDWDLEAWHNQKTAARLGRREATAFVSGNGVAKPRGFLEYAHASAPTKANWQRVQFSGTGASAAFAAAPNAADVFVNCIGSMKEFYLAGAIWAMNRLTKATARLIKDSDGHYILLPDFRDGFRETLLGLPVVGFEDMPAIAANSYSIALANFREGYTIVDRRGITILRDPYTAKPFVHFYTTRRVGGDVTNFEAIKLIKFI